MFCVLFFGRLVGWWLVDSLFCFLNDLHAIVVEDLALQWPAQHLRLFGCFVVCFVVCFVS